MFSKQLPYLLLSSLLFLFFHVMVLFLKLNEGLNFLVILSAMILTQLLAFGLVRRKSTAELRTFVSIFLLMSVTQFFSVMFLTLYSAFDPFGEPKPIHLVDVLTSIVLFVVVLPLIIATLVWFMNVKRRLHSR
jgi:hypothetical protein